MEDSNNGKHLPVPVVEMRGSDPKKRKVTVAGYVSGRWSKKEHIQFIKGTH